MTSAFYWLLNLSILGSLTGLILMCLRKVKFLPRFAVYALWSVVALRLLVPFGVASRFSLLTLVSHFTTKTVTLPSMFPHADVTTTNSLMLADHYFPVTFQSPDTSGINTLFSVAGTIWMIGASAAILTALLLYHFTKSELKTAEHLRDNIYSSDKIMTPSVYGILHPKIILPNSLPEDTLDYVLAHENVHLKRRDNLLRMMAILIACLHWFNPLVWIFLRSFLCDLELACDAKVLKSYQKEEQKSYALALLTLSKAPKTVFSSAFGSAKIKVRLETILSYRKLTALSTLCFAAFCLALAAVLLTGAAA